MMKVLLASYSCLIFLLGTMRAGGQAAQTQSIPPAKALEIEQEIQRTEALLPTIPDRAAVLFFLAHDYARVRNFDRALSLLKECISHDEGFDPEGDPAFDELKTHPEYQRLIERVHRRYPVAHRARFAFTVPEKELIPEGLAVDGAGTFYMSSLYLRKIVKISSTDQVSDFVRTGQYNFGPICGLKVDPADGSLWADICPDSGTGAELLHFNRTGILIERFLPPTGGQHLFNDLVLRNEDEVYLTDSLDNRAFRFNRESHRFTELGLCRSLYYPNGIAISGDGNLLYIADAFGIVLFDINNNQSYEVDPGPSNTVSGADGLYWYHNSLIAIQNSLGVPRVAQFRLSADGRKVRATVIFDYRSPASVLPTTGAIVGSRFYFMSNTQVDNLSDNKILDPAKLEAIRVAVVKLQK